MAKARREFELSVRVRNQPGVVGKVLTKIAEAGVNIVAFCTYHTQDDLVMLLVTDDPHLARASLEQAGFACTIQPVVIVGGEDHVGAVAQLGALLGDAGIQILYSYASSAGQGRFIAVFKTSNDARAIQVLESSPLARITALTADSPRPEIGRGSVRARPRVGGDVGGLAA